MVGCLYLTQTKERYAHFQPPSDLPRPYSNKCRVQTKPGLRAEGVAGTSTSNIYSKIKKDKLAGGDLWMFLRHSRKTYRKTYGGSANFNNEIKNRVSIDERPDIVDFKERRANENTNGQIRQYIPKGSDITKVTKTRIKFIERSLNSRPRKTLNFLTPIEAESGGKV